MDESRRDGVHRNVVLAPFDREAFGQVRDGGLGHAVNRLRGQGHEPRLGPQIDNVSAILPDHHPSGSLTREEGSLQVHRQRQVEVLVLLQADVTASTDEDEQLLKRFGLFGPPGILFFCPSGKEIETMRVIGFQPAERFIGALEGVLRSS